MLMVPASARVSPTGPLKATSPPFNLTENPASMVMVTVTWLAPEFWTVTQPTDPERPRLLAERSKPEHELASACGVDASMRASTLRVPKKTFPREYGMRDHPC